MPLPPSPLSIVGQDDAHLCSDADAAAVGARVHIDMLLPLLALQRAAAADGFALTVLSAFRSFDRQLSIWNRKSAGELAVLDSNAVPLDVRTMSPREIVLAILRWSALPGASRHHWGSDIDVYDAAATPPGYEVQLIPAEVDAGGMHAPMHEWLDARIANGRAYGFYRPYDIDRGGVAPERWHLSYAPVACTFASALTPDVLHAALAGAELFAKDEVLAALEELYARFVVNVTPPPNHTLT